MRIVSAPTGYGIVQYEVMKSSLPIQAKAIYAYLCSLMGNKDYCFPKIETICEDMGLSKPMVIKYLNILCELGKTDTQPGLIEKSKLYSGMKQNHKYKVNMIAGIEESDGKNKQKKGEKQSQSKADLTPKVKPTLPSGLNQLNPEYITSNSITSNSINIESLFQRVKKSFVAIYGDFEGAICAKEHKHINILIKNAEQKCAEFKQSPEELLRDVLNLAHNLWEKGVWYMAGKPFLPSSLVCNWPRLITALKDDNMRGGTQEELQDFIEKMRAVQNVR